MQEIRKEIRSYVEVAIIPRYAAFDRGHREDHARHVISQALSLAAYYPVNPEVIYIAAACHDLGLSEGRELHHMVSGRMIREDANLRAWFTPEEIETAAEAAEDHRASLDHEPRSIYGRIVAEADRQIIPETVLRRTVQYGLGHYPELDREGHWERTHAHLMEKYGEGGYLKLWIPESPNAARLAELRRTIADIPVLRSEFERIFEEETRR